MIEAALRYLSGISGASVSYASREELERNGDLEFLIKHNDLTVNDLQGFQKFRRRQVATFKATRITGFARHVENELARNEHEKLEVYVSDCDCSARVIYDLWGKDDDDLARAGHARYQAVLELPMTGDYLKLRKLESSGAMSQSDAIHALESVLHVFENGEEVVRALRSLDSSRIGTASSTVQPLSREKSVLEKVDVSSKGDLTIPDRMTATFEPYPELGHSRQTFD